MNLSISLIFNRACGFVFFLFFFSGVISQTVDSSNYKLVIGNISINGNKITKSKIITRELVKRSGDTIDFKDLPQMTLRTQQNIFNTQLFIYDTVKYKINEDRKFVDLDIKVKERWYIIPQLIFEIQDRNINQWIQHADLFRINYGAILEVNNFTGVRDKLSFIFRRGYAERYGVSYSRPYLNKAQTIGINASYAFSRNNEVSYLTDKNVLLFHRDYKKYMRTEHSAAIGVTVRSDLYQRNSLELIYNNIIINDTISDLNSNFFGNGKSQIAYFGLQYRYSFDKRDNKPYPLKGITVDLGIVKDGLNYIYDEAVNNLYVWGSLRKYTQLYKRFYLANLIKARYYTTDKLLYYFNRALGYSDFIRGYEYYVMDGQNFFLSKNSLKFQLLKTKVWEPKFLRKIPQFSTIPFAAYINLNFDAGYVQDNFYGKNNPLTNSWQYGYGVGIDLVTYYDIVIGLEYSFNKLMQNGFFLHLSAGI